MITQKRTREQLRAVKDLAKFLIKKTKTEGETVDLDDLKELKRLAEAVEV